MKEKNPVLVQSLILLVGEIIVSALTVLVFYLLGKFSLAVVLGTLLGTLVVVGNFLVLAIVTDRAFREAEADRGNKEMTDEEIEKFTQEHKASLQAKIQVSSIVRTFTMLGVLVLACLLQNVFSPIALVVPLLLFRPLLTVEDLVLGRKKG